MRLLPDHLRTAWWGLVSPRLREQALLEVVQGVVHSEKGVLLAVRRELRGWELPGGGVRSDEEAEQALRREILEETGVQVEVERLVGEYRRSGFRPHRARVFLCRAVGGTPTPSPETPRVGWFDVARLPATLFPWFRGPLQDALGDGSLPVARSEHQGVGAILRGAWIDLRMRLSDDRAGLR